MERPLLVDRPVSPASAGMSPASALIVLFIGRKPRVSGDEPITLKVVI